MGIAMKLIISALLSILLLSTSAWAAAGEDDSSGSGQPPAWKKAVADQDWAGAITLLEAEVAADKGTANVHNMLGYSYRKAGNFDKAFEHYAVALKKNPEHRGAHEYVGQTYLAVGNLEMAKKHLDALDRICFFGCEEFDDLKQAIAAYRPK
jgi:tetratricopeptide (TPR) repeat protein